MGGPSLPGELVAGLETTGMPVTKVAKPAVVGPSFQFCRVKAT